MTVNISLYKVDFCKFMRERLTLCLLLALDFDRDELDIVFVASLDE